MSIDAPAVGERIVYTFAADVAEQLNKSYPLTLDADESTNAAAASASDVTGLTFPVLTGKSYEISLRLDYSCANTNQGIGIGIRHPGGTAHGLFRATGPSGFATETLERLFENAAATDELTTYATVGSGGSHYVVEATVFYACTADGTFAIRKARNGTPGSTGVTLYKGSRAIVTVTG